MTTNVTLEQIDELAKCKYLKEIYAGLLFEHHPNNESSSKDSHIDATKAANEFLRIFYPFGGIADLGLSLYIANNWPQDPVVMKRYLIFKETQAQGFFLPNKNLYATKIIEIMDSINVAILNNSNNTIERKRLRTLQDSFHKASNLFNEMIKSKWNMNKHHE